MARKKSTLADEIRRRLKQRGLYQKEMCEKIGITTDYLYMTLSRNSFPKTLLLMIARFLGFSEDLENLQNQFQFTITCWGKELSFSPNNTADNQSPVTDAQIFTAWVKLPKEKRAKWLRAMQAFQSTEDNAG